MPKPVRELLRLVHIERVDLERVNGKDLSVLRLLKEQEAETYHRLLKQLEKTENPQFQDSLKQSQANPPLGIFYTAFKPT